MRLVLLTSLELYSMAGLSQMRIFCHRDEIWPFNKKIDRSLSMQKGERMNKSQVCFENDFFKSYVFHFCTLR